MNVYFKPSHSENESAPRPGLWHRFRPGVGNGRTTTLFWAAVFALGCIALLSVAFGGSWLLARNGSEKPLRVDLLLPKLKSNHRDRKAEPFRMSEPEPSESAHPKDWNPPKPSAAIDQPKVLAVDGPRLSAPTSEPGLHLVPSADSTQSAVETCNDPAVYLKPCSSPLGDSPMMRNWKTLTMYSLLSAATVAVAPAAVVSAQEKIDPAFQDLIGRVEKLEKKKTPAVDTTTLLDGLRAEIKKLETGPLADLSKQVKGVGDDVQDLQTRVLNQKLELEKQKKEIDFLAEEVRGLQKKLLTQDKSVAPALDKAVFEEMRNSLKAIQEGIAKLGTTETSKRMSMSLPNGSATTNGRVVLNNFYQDRLLFYINGVGYRVPAGMTQIIDDVPLGALRFLVHSERWGTLQERTATLTPDQRTFTVTANNPR